jgi:predicted AlkP superfamily pyrophosphatase or phosphodiesterase
VDRQGEWAALGKRFLKDAMIADLAADLVRRRQPDLLFVHFLSADSLQHLHGPRSPEALWAIEYLDSLIGKIVAATRETASDRTTFFVVSDHGFLPVSREVRVNVCLAEAGFAGTVASTRGREAIFVMNHGAGYVYATGRDARDAPDDAWLRDLAAFLAKIEGVSAVWTAHEYPELGLPQPSENAWVGDLLVEAAPGYCFADDAEGEAVTETPRFRGTHGQRPTYEENGAFFLASGARVTKGTRLPPIQSRDLAPTLARLLGIKEMRSEGRVLEEILRV